MDFIIFTSDAFLFDFLLWGIHDLLDYVKEYTAIHNSTDKLPHYVFNVKYISHFILFVINF